MDKRKNQRMRYSELQKIAIAGIFFWLFCTLNATAAPATVGLDHLPQNATGEQSQTFDLLSVPASPGQNVPDLLKSGLKMSAALIVMVGALVAGSYGIRRLMTRSRTLLGKAAMIQVLSTRYLGAKQTLSVIDVEGERFVIGVSPQGISFLTRLPGGDEAGDAERGASFHSVLKERFHERQQG